MVGEYNVTADRQTDRHSDGKILHWACMDFVERNA